MSDEIGALGTVQAWFDRMAAEIVWRRLGFRPDRSGSGALLVRAQRVCRSGR